MSGVVPALGVLAALVGIADTVPYVRDTLRGVTRPHRGTWLIWSVLAIVVCLSQRADGATWSLLMAGTQAVLTSLIFVLAIGRGEGGVSASDRIMIAIAGGGVVGWIAADEPIIATACVVAADLIGATLMVPKTYRDPDSETLATFAFASLGGLLAAGAVGTPDLSLLLYPIYFGLVNGAIALLIVHRRNVLRRGTPQDPGMAAGQLSLQSARMLLNNKRFLMIVGVSTAAFATAVTCLVLASEAAAAPAPVPCTAAGGGKYNNCEWYVPGDGRTGGAKVMVDRKVVGYLHKGTNWIVCQQRGAMTQNAAGDRNSWYGWTQSDHGGGGWVSPVEARGGDDDGRFRGVPDCRGAHGPAPGWGGVWGTTGAAPAPAPRPAPKPVKKKHKKAKPRRAPACSDLREDQQVRVSFRRRVENFQYDKTAVGPGGELWRARDKVYETGAMRINASTCKHGGKWRVLGPLHLEVSSKGLDDNGRPAGRDKVEGFGIGVVGGKGPRERGGPYLDVSWVLCSEAAWHTAAGIVLPKFNKIPNPVIKFAVDRAISKGVKYLQDSSLSCLFPGRFRVRLEATRRGTLIHATKAIHLAPRQTETPRPDSANIVEVWREIPESG